MAVDCSVLLAVLELIFKLKDLLGKLLNFCGHFADLFFVLGLGLIVVIRGFDLLLFQLLDQLALLLVLALRLLCQVLDLLQVEGLLLVVLRFAGFLDASDILLLFEGEIHALCHFLLLPDHVPAQLVELVFGFELNSLAFLEGLR